CYRCVGKLRPAVARNATAFALEDQQAAKLPLSERRWSNRITNVDRKRCRRRHVKLNRNRSTRVVDGASGYAYTVHLALTIVKGKDFLITRVKTGIQFNYGKRQRVHARRKLNGVLVLPVVAVQNERLLLREILVERRLVCDQRALIQLYGNSPEQ